MKQLDSFGCTVIFPVDMIDSYTGNTALMLGYSIVDRGLLDIEIEDDLENFQSFAHVRETLAIELAKLLNATLTSKEHTVVKFTTASDEPYGVVDHEITAAYHATSFKIIWLGKFLPAVRE